MKKKKKKKKTTQQSFEYAVISAQSYVQILFYILSSTMGFSNQDNSCPALGIGKLIKDNLLKGILLQNISFREVCFEHLQTDDQLFFYKSAC